MWVIFDSVGSYDVVLTVIDDGRLMIRRSQALSPLKMYFFRGCCVSATVDFSYGLKNYSLPSFLSFIFIHRGRESGSERSYSGVGSAFLTAGFGVSAGAVVSLAVVGAAEADACGVAEVARTPTHSVTPFFRG